MKGDLALLFSDKDCPGGVQGLLAQSAVFFSHQLKPRLFELTEPIKSPAYFDPVWMSSTYAVREIEKYFKKINPSGDYYYKECAVNARSPENEADEFEKAFIKKMNGIVKNHQGRITVYSESGKGTIFHIYLPLIQMEDSEPDIRVRK